MDQENEDSDEAGVEGFEIVEYGGIAEEENEIAALVESDSEYESAEDTEDLLQEGKEKNVTFDITLPSAHSYLSQDWNELSGRTVHEDGEIISIPILSFPGVVLMPGQLLPLHLFRDADIAMVKYCLDRDRTFGQLKIISTLREEAEGFEHRLASVGTTVEILAVNEEENTGMKVKSIGRQRFELLSKRSDASGNILATVRVLPDKSLPEPLTTLQYPTPYPYMQYLPFNKYSTELDSNNNGTMSKISNDSNDSAVNNVNYNTFNGQASINSDFKNSQDEVQKQNFLPTPTADGSAPFKKSKRSVLYSSSLLTHWPEWVYNQYNCSLLMSSIQHEMKAWNDKMMSVKVPLDPESFSFWVASSLPLDDSMRLELLKMHSCQQRLRFELYIITKCTVMCCNRCKQVVAKKEHVFSMSCIGPAGTYVNPGGHVHETITVNHVTGLRHVGKPSTEASWFPGYAWTIVECVTCHKHMGWRFTVADKDAHVEPKKFWGLCRTGLLPGLVENEPESVQTFVWMSSN